MSLEVLDTLDACLEHLACLHARLPASAVNRLAEAMVPEIDRQVGARHIALFWIDALVAGISGSIRRVERRCAIAHLDEPTRRTAEQEKTLRSEIAAIAGLEAPARAALRSARQLGRAELDGLDRMLATVVSRRDAHDLPTGLAVAASRLHAAELARFS